MSAINFVVRDVAGNISRGSVAGEGVPSSLIVGAGADVSLNLTQGQIISYTRQGQALEITLIDGRTIVIEGFFTTEGVTENELSLSADGFMTEVDLNQGAGADYFANYTQSDQSVGKFAVSDDLVFMRSPDVMLADSFVPEDDQVGMLGLALGGLAPALGLGGAALIGTAAVIGTGTGGGGGGGGGGPVAPVVDITGGTDGNNHVVNKVDHSDGVDIIGTGTPGAIVDVTIDGTTHTTTVTPEGTWAVVFLPSEIEPGEYQTPVDVTITNEGGSVTIIDTLTVDTIIGVDMETPGGIDGVINAVEHAAGVTLIGTVTGGDTVVVTIDGVDYNAIVTGNTWSLNVATGIFEPGEYTQSVIVTAMDPAGNVSSSTSSVVVDTITDVTVDTTTVGGTDGIVGTTEQAGGITLNGTAQAGATVVVTLGTVSHTVIATEAGTWSSVFTASEVPTGEVNVPVTVEATDAAGNTASASSSITVDTITNVTVDTSSVGGVDNTVNGAEHPGGVMLTGTAQPGATVVVTLGTVSHTVTATSAGTWSSQFVASEVPTGEIDVPVNVTATDGAGNTASATGSVAVDTFVNNLDITSNSAGGTDGVVNFNESGEAITMTGTVEAGSSVNVNLHGVMMAATVDANGNWSVTYPGGTLPGGEYNTTVVVTATDAAGNTSSLSEAVTVDTVAGDLALSTSPIELDDVVNMVEAADGVIISGTATPGLVVTVGLGDASMNVLAQPNGTWSVNFPASMVPADTASAAITASITDAAGNYKEVSDTVAIDTVVQPHEFSSTPIEGDNVINGAEAADGVVLSGTVEAGSTVLVEFGGQAISVLAGSNGLWSATFPASAINNAEYMASMTATATDPAGNVSVITSTVQVDTLVNELTTTGPVEGDDVVSASEAADGVTLGGTVEAGSSVVVTFAYPGGVISRDATVDAAGNWSITYAGSEVPGGEYDANITIAATDAHGNTDSITDTFTVDTVAPDVPVIEFVGLGDNGVSRTEVSGTDDNDFTVSTISDSGAVSQVAANGDGFDLGNSEMFSFSPELSNGTHLVVNEMDGAGNENATYVVMEEAGTDVVDLNGLQQFDVGSIDLSFAKDSELTLDVATLEGLSNNDNNLIIHGNTDDSVTLSGAADSGQNATIDGKNYDMYTMGDDAQIYVEEFINVTT